MSQRLALIHTVPTLVPIFEKLVKDVLPGTETTHVVDESLLKDTIRDGRLTALRMRRVLGHLAAAEEAGADVILVTCSSIGPAVDASLPFLGLPVLRVDEPMADAAVHLGSAIGVLATLATTLEPTAALVGRRAVAAGRHVSIHPHVCDGAFQAIMSGDLERHDKLVRAGLKTLIEAEVEVVVLAQASMARVIDALPADERTVPILSSPALAVERLRDLMGDGAPAA